MDVERESGNRFTLSANTFSLVLSDVWGTGSLDLHAVLAILLGEFHVIVFLFLYSNSILEPLNCEDFIVELAFEFRLGAASDWLRLWELEEEWILDFSEAVLVGHGSSGCVQEFEFLMLADDKHLTRAEAFTDVVEGFACVGTSVYFRNEDK